MLHKLLSEFSLQAVAVLLGLIVVTLISLIQRSARPNLRFHSLLLGGHQREQRILLRNFDPIDIQGPLRFEVQAGGRIEKAWVFAGPYARHPEAVLAEPERRTARFELDVFPASGAVVLLVITQSPAVNLTLRVSTESGVVAQGEIHPSSIRLHRLVMFGRWVVGLAIGGFSYAWGYFFFFKQTGDPHLDSILLAALGVGSVLLFLSMLQPKLHEETIAGYLGRSALSSGEDTHTGASLPGPCGGRPGAGEGEAAPLARDERGLAERHQAAQVQGSGSREEDSPS